MTERDWLRQSCGGKTRTKNGTASFAIKRLSGAGHCAGDQPICSTVSASAGGVLSQFAGDWSGEGTVTTTAGPERIRCKVHYDVAPDGTALDQTLHCASDSYKLEVKSKVSAAGTQLTGKWNEITRDTIGNISGTIANTEIKATIEGIGFTADLAISMQANRQSITINPTGATDISQVAITLKRT